MDRKNFLRKSILTGIASALTPNVLYAVTKKTLKVLEEQIGLNHLPNKEIKTMKTVLHKANSRGHANHGWLESYHTFSFANYYNPERMHFGALRVFNDDYVQPKMGFGTHPHNNMEIISIPLSGALSHKDSMGNKKAIATGEVQTMTAGSGLTHSEFNDSSNKKVNFFQLWIIPSEQNVVPRYEQKHFKEAERKDQLQVLVSSVNSHNNDSLKIHQDAQISRITLSEGNTFEYTLKTENHGVYIMNIDGGVLVANELLATRDAIGIWDTKTVKIVANSTSDILLVEVPMTID